MEHFTIEGSLFLAFANHHGDIKKYKTISMVYTMDESTGRFTLYQTLQTRGAHDLEYFSIFDKHFLAVANHYDGTYQLDSESCVSSFRKYPQKVPATSHFSR